MNVGVPSPGATSSAPEATVEESRDYLRGNITSRGRLLIASCRSGGEMAAQVVEEIAKLHAEDGLEVEVLYLENVDGQFSDSETYARLSQDVNGGDVYLFQAPLNPKSGRSVDQNYMAFLIAMRAFREWGANHVR